MLPQQKKGPSKALRQKQFTMLGLMVALAFALYLNWNHSMAGEPFSTTELVSEAAAKPETEKNYGDAKYVSSRNDYFAEARLMRTQSRDGSLEDLEKVLSSSELTEEQKDKARETLAAVTAFSAKEAAMESMIKAKGFSDCVVFMSQDSVKVMVASSGLTDSEVARITEIVTAESDLPASAINIVEIS